jgi:hypothetical protein
MKFWIPLFSLAMALSASALASEREFLTCALYQRDLPPERDTCVMEHCKQDYATEAERARFHAGTKRLALEIELNSSRPADQVLTARLVEGVYAPTVRPWKKLQYARDGGAAANYLYFKTAIKQGPVWSEDYSYMGNWFAFSFATDRPLRDSNQIGKPLTGALLMHTDHEEYFEFDLKDCQLLKKLPAH